MTRRFIHFVFLSVAATAAASLAGEPSANADLEQRPGGQTIREYTKQWTDDYFNFNRVVYRAYTKTLKDETGLEIEAEIWHGLATGYHENGKQAWECIYRSGRREGEFSMWAENGARTYLVHCEAGLVHGKSTQWASDGRKVREETFRRGKLDGVARWWAPDGKLACEGTYKNGRPWDGTFVS